ncbi:MAG: hypothetical protein ACOH2V_01080 [Candidatus Saccharimonadaceae bacterium]
MEVELVKRMLTGTTIGANDLTLFISDYVKDELSKDISPNELAGIIQLLQMGFFNLRFALLRAAERLNLTVLTANDGAGNLLNTYVY